MKTDIIIHFKSGRKLECTIDPDAGDSFDFYADSGGYILRFGGEKTSYIYPTHTISRIKVKDKE